MKVHLIAALTFFLVSCNQADKTKSKTNALIDNAIMPPLADVNIPYSEYRIDASKGDTLLYKTGSIILFPPNSFVDKDGNLIQGLVQVRYREFLNPISIYISGIPMAYDSLDTHYTFESSGMCEVHAYKDGLPVFVNSKSKPEINLVSTNNASSHGLYFLDTIQKKWINKGSVEIIDLKHSKKEHPTMIPFSNPNLDEPLAPEKADDKRPVIKIVIDPASFKELLVYNNLQFQLEENEKKFNPKDTIEQWDNVELIKGPNKGLYTVKFSNHKRAVSYSARPVLQGKDYEKALKIFEKNNAEYKKKLLELQNKIIKDKAQYLKDSLNNLIIISENERIERLNVLIEARNKEIEKIIDASQSNKIIRSFQIGGFGIWNCDKAISLNCLPITANFEDVKGNKINLTNIAVLYKSFNGILKFNDNKILVVKDSANMIIGIYSGKIAYITYSEYSKLKITPETKEQTFIMSIPSDNYNNYEFIKKVSEQ
jgi:hypothetical protein